MTIGLCWHSRASRRSSPYYTRLEQWQPVLRLAGIHWVSLQYDNSMPELTEARQRWGITIHAWEDLDMFDDLDGVAALMDGLDLVMAHETMVAVLAASLG
jgi:hypothetical protein